ncbi:uncharacterized protein F5891DRAFT_1273146 [Suillus fuscotomentosus]|uniref:Uncharacterized protein n=1 Tax=Suillus fuscotomentosus TaxID=1912939 RepID=A0AAD4EM04_9AGAM|nr:uncharacterized protein F5891DRAFT_1273146 [Suillus fuscotomentosus]KAG1908570.1 hypothetical protein F5891DRAFT_1273146 [Suillus fuscotomentosus]
MATATVSTSDKLLHKPTSKSSSTTEATLQSLYNRAARAFLHRDVAITFTLSSAAFALLPPPLVPSPDPLDVHRRKWDILRITLETTVFSSTPDLVDLPQPLRESLLLSPQSFISNLYARSLALFTPSSLIQHQDRLSKYWPRDHSESYHKVLELYCLHVLPRLGEWEYVKEFLSYENELSSDKRRELHLALEAQHTQALESTKRETPKHEPPPSPIPIPPLRSLSSASSSSSLSTTSTRTAVPASHRPKLTRQQSASSTSAVSDVTVTRSPRHHHNQSMPQGSSSASAVHISHLPPVDHNLATAQPPTSLVFIRSYFNHYFTANRIATLSVLFFLVPLLSLVLRRRRRLETPADWYGGDYSKHVAIRL